MLLSTVQAIESPEGYAPKIYKSLIKLEMPKSISQRLLTRIDLHIPHIPMIMGINLIRL